MVPGLNTEDSSITASDLKIKELWKIKSSPQLQGPQRIQHIQKRPDESIIHQTLQITGLSKAMLAGCRNAIYVLQGWRSLLMPPFFQCQLWLWWLKMSQWWQAEKFNLFILVSCSRCLLVKKISQNIIILNLLLLKTCWYLYYLLIIKINSYFQGSAQYVHSYFVMTVRNLTKAAFTS